MILCLAFLLAALPAGLAPGSELTVTADVDRPVVNLGERVQLTIIISGSSIDPVPRLRLPWSADFRNCGSTQAMFTHGDSSDSGRTQTLGVMYTIEPKRVGRLAIGPVRFSYNGTLYQSRPVVLTVVDSGAAGPRVAGWADQDGVALLGTAEPALVYVGEPVTVSYTLFSRSPIGGFLVRDVPGFTGFWAARVDDAPKLDWRPATFRGEQCSSAVVRRAVLFPTQPGTLAADRMTLAGVVSLSGGLFRGSYSPFTASSEPVQVFVRPLPDSGRPDDFCGGVGEFGLSARLSGEQSGNGEPLVLEVTVSGTGNLGIIGVPRVDVPRSMKLLEPEAKLKVSGISGTRTFRYSVIPQAEGLNLMPAVSMSFFSPESGRYYTLVARPGSFVAGGTAQSPPTSTGVKVVGSDIRHIKPLPGTGNPAARIPLWWACYPLGAAVVLTGAFAGRRKRRLKLDRGFARRTGARQRASRRFREAARHLAAGDKPAFYSTLSRAVLGYAGDRFNVETTGLTGSELNAALLQQGADAGMVDRLREFVTTCDTACFSPDRDAGSPPEALVRARKLVRQLR